MRWFVLGCCLVAARVLAHDFCSVEFPRQDVLTKKVVPTPAGWTVGNKRVIVLRLEFPDRIESTATEQQCREMMDYADRFMRTNSYGALTLTTTISPPLRLAKPEREYGSDAEIAHYAWELAGQVGIREQDFDLDVFVGLRNIARGAYAVLGARGTYMTRPAADYVIVHELGHNLGLMHANGW